MATRQMKTIALRPEEAAALESAQSKFLQWFEGLRSLEPKNLTALRQSARDFRRALQPFLVGGMNENAAHIRVRMQQIELHQRGQAHYAELLTLAAYTAQLVEQACGDIPSGVKADARVYAWISIAADEWHAAKGKPSERGRFAQALDAWLHKGIPRVGGEAQIAAAGVDPKARAETLTTEQFGRLALAVAGAAPL